MRQKMNSFINFYLINLKEILDDIHAYYRVGGEEEEGGGEEEEEEDTGQIKEMSSYIK